MNADENDQCNTSGCTRKRAKNMKSWKSTICKRKRNLGEAYTTRISGKDVPARTIGEPCKCGCFDKIGQDNIQVIFKSFWSMGDYDMQNAYLSNLVSSHEVKRSVIKGRPSRTLRRIQYTVKCDATVHTVCRKAFFSMHGISEKRIRTVLDKQGNTGTVSKDQRGQCQGKQISCDRKQTVTEHIQSLATVSSHYSRAKSPHRRYLAAGLNMSALYNLYLEWIKERYPNSEPVTKHYYTDVFNTQYNIGFEPPKTDTCNFCDKYKIELQILTKKGDMNIITELRNKKKAHDMEAKAAHALLKSYKINTDISVAAIAVDLQQAMPTPKLTSGIQYYKRKMWTYNLGIHNIKTGCAAMYVWDETIAKRGSCEIASCLKHYISSLGNDIRELVIFSDNCPGQNKNINMVLGCLKFIHDGRFRNIKHIFMTPGHSYLPCDRDFGLIEKKVRHSEVYTRDHYVYFIKNSRSTRKFNVIELTSPMVLDFSVLEKLITRRGLMGANFKNGRMFEFSDSYMQGFAIHPNYESRGVMKICLQKGKNNNYNCEIFNLSAQKLTRKFATPLKMASKKLQDLNALMPYVPLPWRNYFDKILNSGDVGRPSDQDNVDVVQEEEDDDQPDY